MTDFYKQNGSYFTTSGQKILNPTELQNLAKAGGKEVSAPVIPQGATKIASPDQLKGLTESQIFRQGQDIYRLPTTPEQISSTEARTNITPVTQTSNIDSFVQAMSPSQKGAEEAIKLAQTPSPAEAEITPTRQRITELTGQLEKKPEDFQKELDKYGFQGNVQQLQELNLQMASAKAEYDKIAEQVRQQPALSSVIGGKLDRLQRSAAINLGGLSAMSQALQGNVNMAMDIANRTIEVQYEPLLANIENQKYQLSQIESQLDREDKRKYESLQIALDERQRQIEEEKLNTQTIQNLAIGLIETGNVDTATISQIMNAKSPKQAIELAVKSGAFQKTGTWTNVGQVNGEDLFYDEVSQTFKTASQLIGKELGENGLVSPSGNAYDMSTYATDPKHAQSVQKKINEIGKLESVEQIDAYIKSKYPNSNLTGDMIANASAEYGVGWEELVALIEHESYLGTSNVAKANNNLGGITWNANFPESMKGTARPSAEGGNYVKFDTLQDGVNSVAYELAKRKVDLQPIQANTTDQIAIDIFNGTGSLSKVSTKDYPAVQRKLGELKADALASGDLEGVMRASAGGKDVDATTAQSFEKAFNVIGQLEQLNESIEGEVTDPILGIIRSNNPYDAKARLIEAQLTALIPNLARGIYGEVGVLTDNDVKLYAATLPNLKSTEEVRNLILASTVRSVQRSIENKIKTQTGLGRDLSGLVDLYQEIKSSADILEGKSGLANVTSNESEYLKSLGLSTQITQDTGDKKSIWNWFRGLFGASPQQSQTDKIQELIK